MSEPWQTWPHCCKWSAVRIYLVANGRESACLVRACGPDHAMRQAREAGMMLITGVHPMALGWKPAPRFKLNTIYNPTLMGHNPTRGGH